LGRRSRSTRYRLRRAARLTRIAPRAIRATSCVGYCHHGTRRARLVGKVVARIERSEIRVSISAWCGRRSFAAGGTFFFTLTVLSRVSAIGLFPRFIDLCDKDCCRRIGPATSVRITQASASCASDPDFAALNPGYHYDSLTRRAPCRRAP
jgi:hypothetical protein